MSRKVVDNPTLAAKLEQVISLCYRLGISITHEDSHGAFEIDVWSEDNATWLRQATDLTRT